MLRLVLPVAFAGNYYLPAVGPTDVQWRSAAAPAVTYSGDYQYQFLAPAQTQPASDWGSAAGMLALGAAIGLAGTKLAARPAYPAPLAMLNVEGSWINPDVQKSVAKVVDKKTVAELLELTAEKPASFCRCWRSGTLPFCDASHVKFNKETGDNVGPLVIVK